MTAPVRFIDTTLRDGQQSLWALQMRLEMAAPIFANLDAAGYDAAEFLVPSTQFVRSVKQLREDPWQWVKLGSRSIRATPLRITGGGGSYFADVPRCVEELLLARMADYGLRTTRISDPWNDFSNTPKEMERFARFGMRVVLNVIYSVSPRHTLEYYRTRVRDAAALKPYRICFKDVGGLLTPDVARDLLPVVVEEAAGIPVEFHAHCNNGMAPYCALIAAESGIRFLHSAMPPLADGSSQPSVLSLAANLQARGIDAEIDLEPVHRMVAHLRYVAEVARLPVGTPRVYDEADYRHQVPGGMISNLRLHLRQVGMADRLEETLTEAAHVRADLGYPIMVTPLSQYVGAQAAVNVMTGTRYGVVTDEVIAYALGRWGREATTVMDPEVRSLILDRARAREIEANLAVAKAQPTLEEVRTRYSDSISDEELILRVMTGADEAEVAALDRREPSFDFEEFRRRHHPLLGLLERVLSTGELDHFEFREGDGEIVLERAGGSR